MRPSLFRTLLLVLLAASVLIGIDTVLARTERRETAAEADRFYREGLALLRQGKPDAAADAFHSAIANSRENRDYPLALGQALFEAGRLDEAQATLDGLLKIDAMSGGPNLAIARVFWREGDFTESAFYYHRAIYGQWRRDAVAKRIEARFELAGLLASSNSKAELLAELLPLQDEAPPDAFTRAKIARLYLQAGSPARASTIFHELLRTNPDDASSLEGLGRAEFALGNYVAARRSYLIALRFRPDDKDAQQGAELSHEVLDLDPMQRGLSTGERYSRALHVLDLVLAKVAPCEALATSKADQIAAANALLKRRIPVDGRAEVVEEALDAAMELWQAGGTACKSSVDSSDRPLELVLAKLGQSPA